MKRVVLGLFLMFFAGVAAHAADDVGVLVLAHGGTKDWDGTVRKAVKAAHIPMPTEVALGMGMHTGEIRRFREAVNRLERRGLSRIVVVPLLVSSYSEVSRQYEYVLGLRQQPEWPVTPLDVEVPVIMGKGLDDHPLVSELLLERAQDLSSDPATETVIIVGHGPVSDEDNQRWADVMTRLASRLKIEGQFREVLAATLRDDASQAVKDQAKEEIRAMVQTAGVHGRVLIVPLLMARGGIEEKIPKALSGLSYIYRGKTLLPSRQIQEWLRQQAEELAAKPTSAMAEQPASDEGKEASASQTSVLQYSSQ